MPRSGAAAHNEATSATTSADVARKAVESAADRRRERELMVQQQIEARGVDLPAVLDAMRSVPRERFLPEELDEFAYHDAALPIAEGQTISQPFVVALMASALDPKPEHRVLEIGTGSGYGAAVLSRIVREVYTVERHASLAAAARQQLDELGYRNVVVRHGDGTLGDPEHAPFDGIVVTAAGREVPKPLLEQLAIGGRMVIPVGEEGSVQRLRRITRTAQDDYTDEDLGEVRFVPLVSGSAAATASAGTEPHAEQAAGSHATANESRPRFPWFRRAADGEDLPARVTGSRGAPEGDRRREPRPPAQPPSERAPSIGCGSGSRASWSSAIGLPSSPPRRTGPMPR